MTLYRNGYIPRAALICIATGTNGDGYWEHLLSPAQLVKHNALVARAKQRTNGRVLKITSGWNAYRPYAAQVSAKQKYGPDAAAPGYSSHGGTYNNRDAMAMDYGNWSSVYSGYGGQAAFYEDCLAVGLTPGVIAREAWHVIDFDPWAAVPSGTIIEGEDMPLDDNDKQWLNDMGSSIVAQVAQALSKLPVGVWDHKIQAQDSTGHGVTDSQGKAVSYPASGYLASINALSGAARGEIVKVNAAIAGLATPDLSIDVDALAAELRDALAPEIVKALGAKLSG